MQPEYEPYWVTEQLAVLKRDWDREYLCVAERNAVTNADPFSHCVADTDCESDAIAKPLRVNVADRFGHTKCDPEPQHDAIVERNAYSDADTDVDA